MIDEAIVRAEALEAAGRHDEAEAACHGILRLRPESLDARYLLARLAIRRRNFGAATPFLRQSLCLEPSGVHAHYLGAVAASEQGDAATATRSWERTTLLAPPDSEPARQAAELCQVFAWLVPAALPPPRSSQTIPADPPMRWLFVWRELEELLHHFRRADIGKPEIFTLARLHAGRQASLFTLDYARRLLTQCDAMAPDIVVAMPGLNPYINPNARAFGLLRERGIPTVLMLPDLRKGIWQRLATAAARNFDLVVSLDGCALETLPALALPPDRFMRGWTPIHPPTRTPPFAARPVPINMLGTLWGERRRAADALLAAGFDVLTRERLASADTIVDATTARAAIPADLYMEQMANSAITVNFSQCQTGEGHQLKGRVLEAAAAGTLLLESENDTTSDFFEPGSEYVPFSSLDDLLAKITYYLGHRDEAATIAERARAKTQSRYGAKAFWREVADRARTIAQKSRRTD